MGQPVIFTEARVRDGRRIMRAQLNAPRSLNALSLEMIRLLQAKLDAWAKDPSVLAIWLEGAGDKSFCAGGDILALYRAMTEGELQAGDAFFAEEYRLDYSIHTYPKPIVVWGNGIVMGGGLGLMVGGGFRVATENSHIAMPEIGIGLFPDVGGGWFLNRMPGRCGLFLGLTGAALNAADAIYLGLADRFIQHERKEDTFSALLDADWNLPGPVVINRVLRDHESRSIAALPASVVREHYDIIQSLTDADSLPEIVEQITNYDGEDEWLKKAARSLAQGSPVTAALFYQQLQRARHASLAEVLRMELVMAVTALRQGEFAEGVRALLVDKDRQPRWRYSSIDELDQNWLDKFFTAPWPDADHPLQDLK